jgi:hypothetical protein
MDDERSRETQIFTVFDENEARDESLPEKSLLLAVLMSAFNDLGKTGQPSREALEYLLNQDDQYLFSFRSVCNCLEIDPDKILRLSGLSS